MHNVTSDSHAVCRSCKTSLDVGLAYVRETIWNVWYYVQYQQVLPEASTFPGYSKVDVK